MAVLLVLGAIPSGLAATVKSVEGLYAVRFFIGILGGTFVPCQAWSTTFYDKNVVGFANAIVGGWGNSGAGITFIIMTSLYNRLLIDGLSSRVAWRAAFAIVPVPSLLITAFLVFYCGTDHPAGKWEDRHNMPAAHIPSVPHGQEGPANLEGDDEKLRRAHQWDKEHAGAVDGSDSNPVASSASEKDAEIPVSSLDTAVNEPITLKTAGLVLRNPLTWLPSLAYLSNFGFEIAIDANLGHILLNLYKSETFTFISAGYVRDFSSLLSRI
jgi:MFS transporter, NNP family, nitrate/nitrite transporter